MIKNFLFLVFIILCIFSFLKLKTLTENKYINVAFDELEPVSNNIPVYLKGVKIGKVYKIILTTETDYSVIRLQIYKKYKIPVGTKAKLKYDRLSKEYITLHLPKPPYKSFLKTDDIIEGSAVKNLRKVLEEHIEKGSMDDVVMKAEEGIENITDAADKINQAADLIVDIIKDNRPEIDKIIANFALASEDTGFMVAELREALKDEQVRTDIKDMAKNLAMSAENIKQTTQNPKINKSIDNVYEMTKELKSSTDKVNCLMCKTATTLNKTDTTLESITFTSDGISEMLSKRFLLFRLMFGKPGATMEK